MFPVSQLLALLIFTTPIVFIFDGPIIHGLVTALAAISVAILSIRMRPGEARFLATVIWRLAVVAVFPALWMLIQVLPLQAVGLASPVWQSAAAALGRPLAGSISIDPGATLICFVRYVSGMAVVFIAAAVAVDRRRAERLFLSLVAATAVIALMSLVARFGDFTFLSNSTNGVAGDAATDCVGLGVILAGTAALHIFERSKSERPHEAGLAGWYRPTFVACIVALAMCSSALIMGATSQVYYAVACGVVVLFTVAVIRHYSLGPWGISAITSIILFIAIAVFLLRSSDQSEYLTLAFATRAPPPLIAVTQRVLSDTGLTGTGAGTFSTILPIYQGIDELAIGPTAPTAAAALSVEMGRPFLGLTLLAAIVLVVTLSRGALRRLRDSLFSTAGSSCVVVLSILAFSNAALFRMPVSIIAAGIVGLAISQSRSRFI